MQKSNIFSNIPIELSSESFEDIVLNKNINIQRIVSRGHTSPESGWYDQNRDEWVIVLRGSAILSFENSDDITLNYGEHINIPAHTKHKVIWTDKSIETIWVAIFSKTY